MASITGVILNVPSGHIPEKYRKYIRELVDSAEVRSGYYRYIEEYSTWTPGLTIEFVWHTHDGQSGRRGTDLIVDFKRDGKYL